LYERIKKPLENTDLEITRECEDIAKLFSTLGETFYYISQITYYNILLNELVNDNAIEEEKLLNISLSLLKKSTSSNVEEKIIFIDERIKFLKK
jgi:hypothetical protein